MTYLAIIIINIVVNPWMAIPSVIMSIIFYYLRVIFVAAGRSLKRIEALSMFIWNYFDQFAMK